MAAKFGYEAIKYVLTKVLTKKGVGGIPTIPGKAFAMRMKQLVDEMANKMRALGYDINKVKEKDVQGLLDSSEALAKQRAKEEALKAFPPETHKFFGRPLTEKDFKEIDNLYPPKTDVPDWTKGWTPKVVPKETVTASPKRIKQGFSTQMKLNSPSQNQDLIKSFIKRENTEFNALNREQQKEILDMFDAYTTEPGFASGGVVDLLRL